MKKRIYSILEVKSREFDSRVFLSLVAANMNYSAIFCKKEYINNYANYMRPGVILVKSIGQLNIKLINKLIKAGHKICSLDEEGLLFFNSEIYCRKRINKDILKLVDYIFCWGKNDYDAIIKHHPEYSKKIKITGSPRIDLLKKNNQLIYKKNFEQLERVYGEYILINTNFGYANHLRHPNYSIVDKMIENGVNDINEIQLHKNKLEVQKIRFKKIINVLDNLSNNLTKMNIIIRPHQSESDLTWKKIISKYKNVKLIRDGVASIPWMLGARVIISFNCTTGLEGKILGLNPLNFLAVRNSISDYKLPNLINQNFYDEDELLNKVYSSLKETPKNNVSELHSEVKDYLFNLDQNKQFESIHNILEYLNELDFSKNQNFKDEYTNFINFSYFKFKRYIKNLINKNKFKTSTYSMLLKQKNKGTTLCEVQERSNEFSENLKLESINVKEIYPDVYCFEK